MEWEFTIKVIKEDGEYKLKILNLSYSSSNKKEFLEKLKISTRAVIDSLENIDKVLGGKYE